MTTERVFGHDHLLGTTAEVRVVATSGEAARAVDEVVVDEIIRLERVFSAFDETSELCRWRRGEPVALSPEFNLVMAAALEWLGRSDGGFNPLAGELTALWRRAESSGIEPPDQVVAEASAAIQSPRFDIVDGVATRNGDCSSLDLNAIAKGFIVDRALDAAMALGPVAVVVNAGGDLAHRGHGSVPAGIENPHRPYDNEPPLAVVEVGNAALATSGDARRGFRVGRRWLGHVIDPLSGWPVDRIASISVLAPDAMTADVVATVAGVRSPTDAIDYLAALDGVEGLVVDADHRLLATPGWERLVIS